MIRKALKCVGLSMAVLLVWCYIIYGLIDRWQTNLVNGAIYASYTNAYDNFVLLDNAFTKGERFCLVWPCSFDLEYAISSAGTQRYSALIFALEDEDIRALDVALSPNVSERVRLRFKSQLKSLLDRPNANPEFLSRVGELYLSGEGVGVDYNRAYAFLAKAWSGGDTQAAHHLTNLFSAMSDAPNTYLWSLRCPDQCLEWRATARAKLDGNQILRIQAVARIDKLMTAGPTPLVPASVTETSK